MDNGEQKTAQEVQDEIFRKMSTEEKIELGVGLWRLAQKLSPRKIKV